VLVAFPYAYEQLARVGVVAPAGLRLAVSAAAPIGPDVRDAWAAAGRPICDYYGLVEVGPVTFNDGAAPDSVGTALPGVRLEIVEPAADPTAGGALLPAGATGRVSVATASMAGDYLDGERPRFAERCPGGALLTQDLGMLDGDGRLRLAGRVGPVANLAGRKVDPAEVRAAVLTLPGVRDAAVFVTDGPGRPVLALVAEGAASRQDLVAGLQGQLADYKIPQIVRVVPALPRGSAGKPLRDRLEEMAHGGGA
jgi:long-chain acyl-CoA synthetase